MPANKYALIRYRVIDECLTNKYRPYPSKEDLRRACEDALYGSQNERVSISTIEKDLYAMRYDTVLGYEAPIEFDKGQRGYYYAEENFTIKKVPLGEEDLEALRFASQTLYQFREMPVFQAFEQLLGKLKEHVSLSADANDTAYMDHMLFDESHKSKGDRHIPIILKAIRDHMVLEFSYRFHDENKAVKTYRIEPLLLKQFRLGWYVIGKDIQADKIKTYGLDRISETILTEELFLSPDFDAKEYFQHTFGISHSDEPPEDVLISVERPVSNYLMVAPLHPSMKKVGEEGERDMISMHLVVNMDLVNELMTWLPQLQVIRPERLRNEILSRCERAIYINSEGA